MFINKELFEKKYQEMIATGKTEDFLDEKAFGNIKVFINKEPKETMFSIKIGSDDVKIGTD